MPFFTFIDVAVSVRMLLSHAKLAGALYSEGGGDEKGSSVGNRTGYGNIVCPYVGNVPLAKKYGMQPLHAVDWDGGGALSIDGSPLVAAYDATDEWRERCEEKRKSAKRNRGSKQTRNVKSSKTDISRVKPAAVKRSSSEKLPSERLPFVGTAS